MQINCPFCGNKIEETEEQGIREGYCQHCKRFFPYKVYLQVKYAKYEEKTKEKTKET